MTTHSASTIKPRTAVLVLIVLLAVQCVTHLHMLTLSAHSGQVAIPWMLNNGKTLFDDVLEQHAPGSSLTAALGQRLLPLDPLQATQLLNLLLVLATTMIVFTLAWHLSDKRFSAAFAAALVWGWWEPVYGNILFYFDSLAGFAIVLAVLTWVLTANRHPVWIGPLVTGFLLGGATLFKQHAWAAVAAFGLWLLIVNPHRARRKTVIAFASGVAILPLLLVAAYYRQGNLSDYIYWNWEYNASVSMVHSSYTGDFLRKIIITGFFVPVFWLSILRRPLQAEWVLLGLMWLAGNATMFPNKAEIHVMAQLPSLSVVTGLALMFLLDDLHGRFWRLTRQNLANIPLSTAGMVTIVLALWLLTGLSAYSFPTLDRRPTPAYDEYAPLAKALQDLSEPGDSLFVLPETDGTPQIHVASNMLPPGTWIKGFYWYLQPDIVDRLLMEWKTNPPDVVVVFPQWTKPHSPAILPLLDFVTSHYEQVDVVGVDLYHGDAVIYRVKPATESRPTLERS